MANKKKQDRVWINGTWDGNGHSNSRMLYCKDGNACNGRAERRILERMIQREQRQARQR